MRKSVFLLLSAPLCLGFAAPAAAEDCALTPRQVVERFAATFYGERKVREAFTDWVKPDYIQHNPLAADGRDAAIAALEPFFAGQPEMRYEVKRIIAEGDLVAVHNHMKLTPADRGFAVVDIFRIEGCSIAEHWDVAQAVPEKSANPHPMF